MPLSEALGRVIRRLRQAQRLTMAALASEAGVSESHLGRIELGRGNPAVGTLLALTGALGVTLGELVLAAEEEAA
jgi:transcriptional regulator with XRE-family HTH domain